MNAGAPWVDQFGPILIRWTFLGLFVGAFLIGRMPGRDRGGTGAPRPRYSTRRIMGLAVGVALVAGSGRAWAAIHSGGSPPPRDVLIASLMIAFLLYLAWNVWCPLVWLGRILWPNDRR